MKSHFLVLAATLSIFMPSPSKADADVGDAVQGPGGDSDPGVEEPPPPLLTHPVEIALDMAPRCGVEPVDWADAMAQFDVDATTLRS